jgi:predicted nucleic acid-binding Zn ribbon protein
MKDAPFKTCPKEFCQRKTWGKGRVKRLMGTGAGLIFKGSGFYITDYRSEGYKASAKKESGESTPAKKTEGKTEAASAPTTPAPKPPAKKKD